MKKTYIAPAVHAVELETESLICLSTLDSKATDAAVLGNRRGPRYFDEEEEWD